MLPQHLKRKKKCASKQDTIISLYHLLLTLPLSSEIMRTLNRRLLYEPRQLDDAAPLALKKCW